MFDVPSGKMMPVAAIVIGDDRIEAVVAEGRPVAVPAGARTIDGRGRFIIPGLIDGHVHLVHTLRESESTGDEVLPLYLANGVTTVRDTGDEIVAQKLLWKFARSHPEISPRTFLCSPFIDGNPPYREIDSRPMTDPAKVPELVDEMVQWGVQTFKLYVWADRPIARAVIREAHRHGKWVTAHLSRNYHAQEAVADGIDSFEHTGAVYESLLPPEIPEMPRTRERVHYTAAALAAIDRRVAEARAGLDLGQGRAAELIASLVRHKVAVDATLGVYRNWMLLRDTPEVQGSADFGQVSPRLLKSWRLLDAKSPLNPATLELRRREFAKLEELTGRMYRAGVEILAGTDSSVPYCPAGRSIHLELELLVESGLTPAAALTAATRNNAHALGQSAHLGSIEPGKQADLVILEADPLADIRNTRKILQVIHSGLVCEPEALLKVAAATVAASGRP